MTRVPFSASFLFRFTALAAPLASLVSQTADAASASWLGGSAAGWFAANQWSATTGGTPIGGTFATGAVGSTVNNDVASIDGTANTSTSAGLNFSLVGSTNSFVYSLGAIQFTRAPATDTNFTIGSNNAQAGTMLLHGATVNGVANTLVRVGSAANKGDLVIAPTNGTSGAGAMGLRLGITNGIFNVEADATTRRNLTISSVISQLTTGSGFTKQGGGVLSLSGNNTYSGQVTVADGVLRVSNAGALGTGTAVLVTNSDVSVDNTNELHLTGGITTGTGKTLTLENLGTGGNARFARTTLAAVNSTGVNTWNGNIIVKGAGGNQGISTSASYSFATGVSNAGPLTINGTITNDITAPSGSIFMRGTSVGIANGAINLGAASIIKTDTGSWTYASSTTGILGTLSVANGTFNINGAPFTTSTGAGPNLSVGQTGGGGAILSIGTGITQTFNQITEVAATSGTFVTARINGGGSLDAGATQRQIIVGDTAGIAQDLVISVPILGAAGVNKTGTGTLALDGNVTGPVLVSAGRLEGLGSLNGGLTLSNGATYSPGTDALSASPTLGGLILNGTNTINLNVGTLGETILNTGGITTGTLTSLNLYPSGTLTVGGVYDLIGHNGSFAGTTGFNIATFPGHATGTLGNSGTALTFSVTANDSVIWTGANSNVWDIDTTANWKLQSNGSPSNFLQGDSVIFDDTGTNTGSITLGATATISQADFINTTAVAYGITGTGKIVGSGGIQKLGNGDVTLAPVDATLPTNGFAHTYTGATNIAAGALTLNYAGLTGTNAASATVLNPASPITLATGATLKLTRDSQRITLNNDVTGGGTLTVDTGVSGAGANVNVALGGNNTNFTGKLILSSTNGTSRTTNAAATAAAAASAFGSAEIVVNSRAQFWGASATYNNLFTLAGVGFAETGGGNVPDADLQAIAPNMTYAGLGALRLVSGTVLTNTITLSDHTKIAAEGNSTATIAGDIVTSGGAHTLVIGGTTTNSTSTIILTGNNSAVGNIWVNSGGTGNTSSFDILQIGTGGTTGTLGSGDVYLHADALRPAYLRIRRSDGYTLASGQDIVGDVTGTTVADLVRTRLELNVTGTGFVSNGNTIDLRDTGANGGDILVGNSVAGASAKFTGIVEARNLQIGVHNTTLATTGAVVTIGDGTIPTTANFNNIQVAQGNGTTPVGNTAGAILNIQAGSTINTASIAIGDASSGTATVNQTGGDFTVTSILRLAHWPNATSVYNFSGGTLNLTATAPTTTPSIMGTPEAAGGVNVGADGHGTFNHSGGTVNTNFVLLDARGATANDASAGTDIYDLTGGTLNLKSQWGVIARHPLSSEFKLNGGTIRHDAPAGTNVTLDTPITAGAALTNKIYTGASATDSVTITRNVSGFGNIIELDALANGKLVFNGNSKTVLDGTSDGLGDLVVEAAFTVGNANLIVEKAGTGTLAFAGANTYAGPTLVSAGTLLLGQSNVLPDTSALTLASGTKLRVENNTDTAGAFTLGGNAIIDMGTGSGASFALASLTSWTGTLSIWNYNGAAWTLGSDKLIFADTSGLAAQLGNIDFYSGPGTGLLGTGGAGLIGNELVPVPEGSSVLTALLLLAGAAYHERRRLLHNR
jgi:fibronectin-binding autotransporter adhesin